MSLAIIYSRASLGIHAPLVTVEAHIALGLPNFFIVGLPEAAVRESKDRVRSAIINSQFEFPRYRITINLAPADLPKVGGRFDLPIALGILAASQQINIEDLADYEFTGELALSGELRPIECVLPVALATQLAQRRLFVPKQNADEAALASGTDILAATHLLDVCNHLAGKMLLQPYRKTQSKLAQHCYPDLCEVRGQPHAKRALEIAAAGGHSLLLSGPPGTGKTMLASRLPGLLPEMNEAEALQVAAIASIAGRNVDPKTWRQRPFRVPHHTASSVALVGGGRPPKPGEISLAHQGILFLDELPEFNRHVLEALREPLESGKIIISRAARQAEFPAKFQLAAAMNPCPCGYHGDPTGSCHCTPQQIQRYRAKISGPLLDRIDLHVEVPRQKIDLFTKKDATTETSSMVRDRVTQSRHRQLQRQQKINAELSNTELEVHCSLDQEQQDLLKMAVDKLKLSARGFHRILRVTRTIADLADRENISNEDLLEALSYRL